MSEHKNSSTLVVSFDIGNTNIHAAVVDSTTLTCIKKGSIPSKASPLLLDQLFSIVQPYPSIKRARISSVVKAATKELTEYLELKGFSDIQFVTADDSTGLIYEYENVANLGADRIADLLYVAKAFPGKSAIVIDAGSAITIDLLTKERVFKGGVIMPGIVSQLKSLAVSTDALPFLETYLDDAIIPGKSTNQCIMAGVLFGIAGGINEIVAQLQEQSEDTCVLLGTGGDFASLQPLLNFMSMFVPDLTVLGTSLYR